jgi:hypothetical protein
MLGRFIGLAVKAKIVPALVKASRRRPSASTTGGVRLWPLPFMCDFPFFSKLHAGVCCRRSGLPLAYCQRRVSAQHWALFVSMAFDDERVFL